MKNQKTLFWAIFVSLLIVNFVLFFIVVGTAMAAGDCVQCEPIPPPQTLYTANNVFSLLGFPLVRLGRFIANTTAMPEGGRTLGGIVLYVLNWWLLAHCASVGIAKGWRKV
jgi:hypothetical protein